MLAMQRRNGGRSSNPGNKWRKCRSVCRKSNSAGSGRIGSRSCTTGATVGGGDGNDNSDANRKVTLKWCEARKHGRQTTTSLLDMKNDGCVHKNRAQKERATFVGNSKVGELRRKKRVKTERKERIRECTRLA